MRTEGQTGHRSATAALGLVGQYALAAGIAYLWSGGKGDMAAITRVGGEER